MLSGWSIVATGIGYVGLLFLLASYGDTAAGRSRRDRADASRPRPFTYPLSLAVYCSSWTFFGSVGVAAQTGYNFLPIYIGPILLFVFGAPLLQRIAAIAKNQNLTSVSDFVAARYGKSRAMGAVVTVLCVVGALPYIALQLKAVVSATEMLLGSDGSITRLSDGRIDVLGLDWALIAAAALAVFAVLFGTRHLDATEHQAGLMLAIATESVVKLIAFLVVGGFVLVTAFGDPFEFLSRVANDEALKVFRAPPLQPATLVTGTVLSLFGAILLPRQFHVAIVENHHPSEIGRASWAFPLYLIVINIFVVPLAAAGLIELGRSGLDQDLYVIGLPMAHGSSIVTALVFLGGLSAATAMIVLESVALAIMVSNSLVVPLLLSHPLPEAYREEPGLAGYLLAIRRYSIACIVLVGYLVYRLLAGAEGLVAIGIVSFAATAQLAPAFFGGLFWRRATASGAIVGLTLGGFAWAYTLILPWLGRAGIIADWIVRDGPFGNGFLKPQAIFDLGLDPVTHGVIVSLGLNVLGYVVASLLSEPSEIDEAQARLFSSVRAPAYPGTRRPERPAEPAFETPLAPAFAGPVVSIGALEATVARYLGPERTRESFRMFYVGAQTPVSPTTPADPQLVRFAGHLLSGLIGPGSAQLVITLLQQRHASNDPSASTLLKSASTALEQNHGLLQQAIDQVRHGLAVFDAGDQLICRNRKFTELLDLAPELSRYGTQLSQILKWMAAKGSLGQGSVDALVADRLRRLTQTCEPMQEVLANGTVLDVRTQRMPQGGIVVTYLDVTDMVIAQRELSRTYDTMERRVVERTRELVEMNQALELAKGAADNANEEKVRFISAASHDILQPLNAARLYSESLMERDLPPPEKAIARNIDHSLSAVEEIFEALLDLSRLDTGRMHAELGSVSLAELFEQLAVEFRPIAEEKRLGFGFVPTRLWVRSDRRLLRRLLQNLLANAVKYTRSGRILLGARRVGGQVRIEVHDTGPGIEESKREVIFREFERLESTASSVKGIGLGLSIVERIGRVLDAPIGLTSRLGRGSCFSVRLPQAPPSPESHARKAQEAEAPAFSRDASNPLIGRIVVVIDNEPTVLTGMQTLLGGWGCRVLAANSSERAVEIVRTTGLKPDFVLADYHLDENLTGLQAIAAVRTASGYAVPAVIITADQTRELQDAVRRSGLKLLRKPLRAGALRSLMSQITLQRNAEAAE